MDVNFSGRIYSNIPVKRQFYINDKGKDILIDVDVATKLECLFYMFIIDPKGVVRVQHLFKNKLEKIILSNNSYKCSRGVYPGEIICGKWNVILFTEKKLNDEKYIEYNVNIKFIGVLDKLENSDMNFSKLVSDINNSQQLNNSLIVKRREIWTDYRREKGRLTLSNYKWSKKLCKDKKWYKGDFHTHSNLSDGKMDEENYMRTAEKMNLDFTVTTEHNILPTGWCSNNKTLIIPGTEITLEDGHFNIFGLDRLPSIKSECSYEEMVINILKEQYKNKRSICSINHPVLEFWKWKFYNVELKYIDTLEICNDPTYYLAKDSNDNAIRLLDILWNDGYKIWGVGGSDAHILPSETYENSKDPSIIGDPATYVYSDGLSAESILNGVKRGNIYVTRGLDLDINIYKGRKRYLPGNEIKIDSDKEFIEYEIKIKERYWQNENGNISAEEEPLKIIFIENGTVVDERIIENDGVILMRQWNRNEFKYLRAEIRTLDGEFRAYINPIYQGTKTHEIYTAGELLEKLSMNLLP